MRGKGKLETMREGNSVGRYATCSGEYERKTRWLREMARKEYREMYSRRAEERGGVENQKHGTGESTLLGPECY